MLCCDYGLDMEVGWSYGNRHMLFMRWAGCSGWIEVRWKTRTSECGEMLELLIHGELHRIQTNSSPQEARTRRCGKEQVRTKRKCYLADTHRRSYYVRWFMSIP